MAKPTERWNENTRNEHGGRDDDLIILIYIININLNHVCLCEVRVTEPFVEAKDITIDKSKYSPGWIVNREFSVQW